MVLRGNSGSGKSVGRDMLARLRAEHRGPTYGYYLDVPLEETFGRHAGRPRANNFGQAELRAWYRPLDLLPGGVETVIGTDSALTETVGRIMRTTGLSGLPARE